MQCRWHAPSELHGMHAGDAVTCKDCNATVMQLCFVAMKERSGRGRGYFMSCRLQRCGRPGLGPGTQAVRRRISHCPLSV